MSAARLTPTQKTAFRPGFTSREIAELECVTPGAIRMRRHRALKKIDPFLAGRLKASRAKSA